ncbi:MAG: 2-hydroxychromene-2-carboxylate isomerase [Alphaproteobacteria bacterium]|nr:2-hydroxychromene-2-carboxylate isomerase [Alphaproteobacteria bacterium]
MPKLEYFYSAHSGFAYLGSARIKEIADAAGCEIVHRPFNLNKLLATIGAPGFHERSKAHRNYFFRREIERWAQIRNAPVIGKRPTYHDSDYIFANCMLIASATEGDNVDQLSHTMLQAHWRDDADLSDHEMLYALAEQTGHDAAALQAAAATSDIQAVQEANTQEAIDRNLFGSPTYFVDGDMIYGQDHLDVVERALKTPFEGTWP